MSCFNWDHEKGLELSRTASNSGVRGFPERISFVKDPREPYPEGKGKYVYTYIYTLYTYIYT